MKGFLFFSVLFFQHIHIFLESISPSIRPFIASVNQNIINSKAVTPIPTLIEWPFRCSEQRIEARLSSRAGSILFRRTPFLHSVAFLEHQAVQHPPFFLESIICDNEAPIIQSTITEDRSVLKHCSQGNFDMIAREIENIAVVIMHTIQLARRRACVGLVIGYGKMGGNDLFRSTK